MSISGLATGNGDASSRRETRPQQEVLSRWIDSYGTLGGLSTVFWRCVRYTVRMAGIHLVHAEQAMSSEIPDGFPQWRIGPNAIGRQDITIVGVAHVSSGSWMPILQLNRSLLA